MGSTISLACLHLHQHALLPSLHSLWHLGKQTWLLPFPYARALFLLASGCLPLNLREKYSYRPLQTSRTIRVLEMLPSPHNNATLCFRAHHVDLDSPSTRYIAISYAWGDRTQSQEVLSEIDHRPACIPSSLHSVLSRLRSFGNESMYLWADALSINQSQDEVGLAEKSLQVQMMGDIFARAEEVVVDLGDTDEETDVVLRALDKYQAIADGLWSQIDIKTGILSASDSVRLCATTDLPGPESMFWPAFKRFICRPWFTRVWIIQEFALAQRPRFLIGCHYREKDFLYDAISRAAKHIEILYLHDRTHDSGSGITNNVADTLWDVLLQYHAIHRICLAADPGRPRSSLCELLDATAIYFQATKDCDKVYALYGLVDDKNIQADLPVDYTEHLPAFMLRVSQYLSQHGAGKYALYHSVGDREHCVSWALNLTAGPDGLEHLICPPGHLRYGEFNACANTRFVCKDSNIRPGALTVRGCIVDTVEHAMKESMPHNSELSTQEELALHSNWQPHALKWMLDVGSTLPVAIQEFTKLCWRVVVADLTMSNEKQGQGYLRMHNRPDAIRCLDSVDEFIREVYREWIGASPASDKKCFSDVQLADVRLHADSMTHTTGKKLALSQRLKTPCLVPSNTKLGDLITVIQGCEIPFILRRKVDRSGFYFRIVGCAYVQGIMDGELVGQEGWQMEDVEIW